MQKAAVQLLGAQREGQGPIRTNLSAAGSSPPPTRLPQRAKPPRCGCAAVITYESPDQGVIEVEAKGRRGVTTPAGGSSGPPLPRRLPRAKGALRASRLPLPLSKARHCHCRRRILPPPLSAPSSAAASYGGVTLRRGRRRLAQAPERRWRLTRAGILIAARVPVRHANNPIRLRCPYARPYRALG